MEDFQSLKKKANDLRKAKSYEKALPEYKILWEDYHESCNEWEGWGYALCLKHTKNYKKALEICREVYKLNPDFNNIKGVYAWCIYYTEIAILNVSDENIFFRAGEAILKLTSQDDQYSPYTLSVIKILKYLSKKEPFPYDKILEWTNKLNPDLLDTKPYKPEISEGKIKELASEQEQYFMWRTKALFKKGLFQDCIDLCNKALVSFDKFHYDNDIWFTRRITLSNKELGNSENALQQLKEILKKKNQWFIQQEIAQLYIEQNDAEEAKKYLIDACLNYGDSKNKIKLYIQFADLLFKEGSIDDAKKHSEFVYHIRKANEFKIDDELQNILNKYQIDITKTISLRDFERDLKSIWLKLKYDNQKEYTGTIKTILPGNKAGFVKTDKNISYYFETRNFKGKQDLLKVGQSVRFYLEEGFDAKKGLKTDNAVNIRPQR